MSDSRTVFASLAEYSRWANAERDKWIASGFNVWKKAAGQHRGKGRRGTQARGNIAWNLRWFHRWKKEAGL